MDELSRLIGNNIRKFRKERSRTQHELAFALGLHQAAISRMEKGLQEISAAELWRISNLLKKPVSLFFKQQESQ